MVWHHSPFLPSLSSKHLYFLFSSFAPFLYRSFAPAAKFPKSFLFFSLISLFLCHTLSLFCCLFSFSLPNLFLSLQFSNCKSDGFASSKKIGSYSFIPTKRKKAIFGDGPNDGRPLGVRGERERREEDHRHFSSLFCCCVPFTKVSLPPPPAAIRPIAMHGEKSVVTIEESIRLTRHSFC